jgi:hypothetical protein
MQAFYLNVLCVGLVLASVAEGQLSRQLLYGVGTTTGAQTLPAASSLSRAASKESVSKALETEDELYGKKPTAWKYIHVRQQCTLWSYCLYPTLLACMASLRHHTCTK